MNVHHLRHEKSREVRQMKHRVRMMTEMVERS